MKTVQFKGWNCVEMQSGDFKILVTTNIGPRIIGGFLKNSDNIFYVDEKTAGDKGGDEWKIYGGHRLWTAPEAKPRAYEPDNFEVHVEELEDGISFSSGTDKRTGMHKTIIIKSLGDNKFDVIHKIKNKSAWDIELAAWALSVMAPGGVAITPQPQGDTEALLPNRYLTIWPYTNMADPRVAWGDKYVLLRQDSNAATAFKFGMNCENGWLAYVNKGIALIKSFDHIVDAEYPDNGCSIEIYSCAQMCEIETLSPLYLLAPNEEIVHTERFRATSGIGEIKNEADAAENFPSFLSLND